MPDLLTHVLIGASIAVLLVRDRNKKSMFFIIFGSIIIDSERPFTWFIEIAQYPLQGLTDGFHSILGAVLLSFAAASLFDDPSIDRKTRFFLLLIGSSSHLLMDMTMGPWTEQGLFLLFPLRIPFSFHLFWSDYPFYPLIGIAVFLVALSIDCTYRYVRSRMYPSSRTTLVSE